MSKIDRRINYILCIDTETVGNKFINGKMDLSEVLAYDIGYVIMDKQGNIYERRSFVVREVFIDRADLMRSAYFSRKIPTYHDEIMQGVRHIATIAEIMQIVKTDCERYDIREVAAHNAFFDFTVLNNTAQTLAGRRFFPRYMVWYDTLRMVREVVAPTPTYKRFCERYGYVSARTGRPSCKAEVVHRYITQDTTFKEAHTGLADVLIEAQFYAYCIRKHKKMRKELFNRDYETRA